MIHCIGIAWVSNRKYLDNDVSSAPDVICMTTAGSGRLRRKEGNYKSARVENNMMSKKWDCIIVVTMRSWNFMTRPTANSLSLPVLSSLIIIIPSIKTTQPNKLPAVKFCKTSLYKFSLYTCWARDLKPALTPARVKCQVCGVQSKDASTRVMS